MFVHSFHIFFSAAVFMFLSHNFGIETCILYTSPTPASSLTIKSKRTFLEFPWFFSWILFFNPLSDDFFLFHKHFGQMTLHQSEPKYNFSNVFDCVRSSLAVQTCVKWSCADLCKSIIKELSCHSQWEFISSGWKRQWTRRNWNYF